MSLRVQVVQRLRIPGTIDGHSPLVVTFRILGDHGWFRLTVVTANFGRGYQPGEFKRNVMNVLNRVGEREYVVLLLQEIDEADAANEHAVIKDALKKVMEPGTTLVHWETREPIVVSPKVKVTHQRKTMTMDQGSTIGFQGLGPKRYLVSCIAEVEGVRIGVANQHPHRYSQKGRRGVATLLSRGEHVTRTVLGALTRVCDLVIDGGDLNTPRYPLSVKGQRIAYHVGLDYIRWVRGRRL